MTRVLTCQHVRELIVALLAEGQKGEADVASTLIRLGTSTWCRKQELLEREAADRGNYERVEGTEPHRGDQNGYNQRQLRGAEGTIPIWRP